MTSSEEKIKDDGLIFHWDRKASHLSNTPLKDHNHKRNLDEYFDFLDEMPPHKQELRKATLLYKQPFTIE